jgi:flagellar hook-associated protein 1 FlgK
MNSFMGIETAKRGLAANQVALNIVGNNIANINTEGYTRQRVDTVSMSATGHKSRFAPNQAALAGQGVTVNGVGQVRDPFLDKRYRDIASETGYYNKAYDIMVDVETALDEYSSSGLKDALAALHGALSELSKNSDQTVNASIVLTAAKNIVQVLNNLDAKLTNIREHQIYGLQIDVEEANRIIKRIADLNHAINQEVFASSVTSNLKNYGPNELMDERNLLLDKLAGFANIHVDTNPDGSVRVLVNGETAVDGTDYRTLNLVRNIDDTISVSWMESGKALDLVSGSLKASLGMINGRGPNAKQNESFDKGIPYFRDLIDNFAANLLSEFNHVLQLKPQPGDIGPKYKTLFYSGGENIVTARNIEVSEEWMKDPAYIIDGYLATDGNFDNTFILKALSLFDKKLSFGAIVGTFEEYVNLYNTSEVGQQVTFFKGRFEAANSVSNELLSKRDSVSAVSLDEEGANLMQFQKAYNAMARLMTALDEALDVLINRTGIIGR